MNPFVIKHAGDVHEHHCIGQSFTSFFWVVEIVIKEDNRRPEKLIVTFNKEAYVRTFEVNMKSIKLRPNIKTVRVINVQRPEKVYDGSAIMIALIRYFGSKGIII
jgi:hypothetical protein